MNKFNESTDHCNFRSVSRHEKSRVTTDNDNDIFLQLGDAESEAVATVVLSPAAALGSDSMDSMVQFF